MALSVKVQNDAYPADTEFEIMGLGVFTNGQEREVTEDQERAFVSMNQKSVEDALGQGDSVSFSGSSAIENIDDVLGRNISDTLAIPEPEEEGEGAEAHPVETEQEAQPAQEAPAAPADTEGGGT